MIKHIINSVLVILIIVLSIPLKIISWIIQIINPGMKAKK
jgi:cytochrome c oxidase assembly factor CtaG